MSVWLRPLLVVVLSSVMALTALGAGPDDLAARSDEFSDPASMIDWQRVHDTEGGPDQLARCVIDPRGDGHLVLMPHAVVWYRDWRGPLLYKPVTGDFVVTTALRSTNRAGNGPPASSFSLVGLMVRAPRQVTRETWTAGGENYVFLSLGAGGQGGRFNFEVKTTRNSNSQLQLSPAPGPDARLRIVRLGQTLLMLRQEPGEPWQVHARYARPDLPETVQVGLTCYTDWETARQVEPAQHNYTVLRGGQPDLLAVIDYVRFRRPDLTDAQRHRNWTDPAAVSDAEVLQHFGGE